MFMKRFPSVEPNAMLQSSQKVTCLLVTPDIHCTCKCVALALLGEIEDMGMDIGKSKCILNTIQKVLLLTYIMTYICLN